jgi:hypothetical protein
MVDARYVGMTILLVAAVYTLGLAVMMRGLQSVPRGYEDDCGFHEV